MSKVLALVDCLRVTVLTEDGELIRELVLDPDREISAARSELTWNHVPTYVGTTSRDITSSREWESNPRPRPYHGRALPTELSRLATGLAV